MAAKSRATDNGMQHVPPNLTTTGTPEPDPDGRARHFQAFML